MSVSMHFGVLFGILAFIFFIHLQIAAHSGWPRHEVYFLGNVLAIFCYDLLTLLEYGTASMETYFFLIRLQAFSANLFFFTLLEFVAGYSGEKPGPAVRVYQALYLALSAYRAFAPHAGTYLAVRGMVPHELPMGATVFLVDGDAGPVLALVLGFVVAGLALAAAYARRLALRGERRMAGFMALGLGALVAGILYDAAVSAGMFRSLYLTETAYVALALAMSFALTDGVIKLSELRKALAASVAEKDALLRENHHRVKNNLAVLAGLVRLQMGSEEDERTRLRLGETLNRIQSIASVHEHAFDPALGPGAASIDLGRFLDDIVANALATFGSAGVAVEADLPHKGIPLPLDLAVPLGLMVNEMVMNSAVHAWTGTGPRTLRYSGRLKRGDGHELLELELGDDGRGWDGLSGAGLGSELIGILAVQLGAVAAVRPGTGTTWEISVPLPAPGGAAVG